MFSIHDFNIIYHDPSCVGLLLQVGGEGLARSKLTPSDPGHELPILSWALARPTLAHSARGSINTQSAGWPQQCIRALQRGMGAQLMWAVWRRKLEPGVCGFSHN